MNSPRIPASILGAVCIFAACTTDPAYVGVTEQPEPEDPEPFECSDEDTCFIERTLDQNVVAQLYTANADAPEIAPPVWHYPLEASVHPSNLGLLTLHFEHTDRDGTIYEVTAGSGESARRMYFPCFSAGGDGCVFQVPELFWNRTANSFAGRSIRLSLRAANDRGVSPATDVEIEFSPSDVTGGLYYWSSALSGVERLVFGGREAVPFIIPKTEGNTEECGGCHAVSRDGSTIAFSQGSSEGGDGVFVNAAFEGSLKVAPVTDLGNASIEPDLSAPSDTAMMTLSREGTRVVSAYDFKLELRSTSSGLVLDELANPPGLTPHFPEYHPEDASVVVTLSADTNSEIGVDRGAIAIIPIEDDAFGEPSILVEETDELSHYYPSWSPNGAFVAFASGPRGESSYDQENSRLRMVSVDSGEVFELSNASGPDGSTSTLPKFTPFFQCESGRDDCDPEERIFFLSYNSKRRYGLIQNNPGDLPRAQLWMSAIYVGRASGAADPSSVPFWVPYQVPESSNHLGYWTEALKCNDDTECGFGQVCELGQCEIRVR